MNPSGQRLLLVMAGAVSVPAAASTPLEQASMPNLQGLTEAGQVGALRTVAPHLPGDQVASAAAGLLGVTLGTSLDPGAVAMEALGKLLAEGETCTVIEVLDPAGAPAPALEVQRAAAALRAAGRLSRVVTQRGSHRLLVAGVGAPQLPQLPGLKLRAQRPGGVPPRSLGSSTVVIAAEGSVTLGVASLLGAHAVALPDARSASDAALAALRTRALSALGAGAQTVVVETPAAVCARTGAGSERAREQTVRTVLETLDRGLIGPLAAGAAWMRSLFAVTSDLPYGPGGVPAAGNVPVVLAGSRTGAAVRKTGRSHAVIATTPGPLYSERSLAGLPQLTRPFELAGPSATYAGADGVAGAARVAVAS